MKTSPRVQAIRARVVFCFWEEKSPFLPRLLSQPIIFSPFSNNCPKCSLSSFMAGPKLKYFFLVSQSQLGHIIDDRGQKLWIFVRRSSKNKHCCWNNKSFGINLILATTKLKVWEIIKISLVTCLKHWTAGLQKELASYSHLKKFLGR